MFANQPHYVFERQPENNLLVRRYLDLPKLIHLLATSTLAMARSDTLKDPYEGMVSPVNNALRPTWYSATPQMIPHLESTDIAAKSGAYISSWQGSENEAQSMWERYANDRGGVAIETTWFDLKESILGQVEIFGGFVTYANRRQHPIPEGNLFYRHMHKSIAFEDEKEVRLITLGEMNLPKELIPRVLYIPIDPQRLVRKVVLAPHTELWVEESIRDVMSRLAPSLEVTRSSLED